MQVKIVKCSNNLFWYNNKIGEIIDVTLVNKTNFLYFSLNNGTSRTILFYDTIPYNRKEKIEKILNNINKCK